MGEHETPDRQARFEGCLLGLAVGDAMGAPFEGSDPDFLKRNYAGPRALLDLPGNGKTLVYTDDTQMMLGVAEALLEKDLPTERDYARRYAENYEPWRGYGGGARVTLECLRNGMDSALASTVVFPDGSFGNGAAMRVAPVGLRFARDPERLLAQARESARPTHRHPLGIEGAVVMARAVSLAVEMDALDGDRFFDALEAVVETEELAAQLKRARTAGGEELGALGSSVTAHRSVPTAVACFARYPRSYPDAVGTAILLGGDTDTIAAMAGAISGAFLGRHAIPKRWLTALEGGPKGRTYIQDLAAKLV